MNWLTSAKKRIAKSKRKHDDQRSTAWKRIKDTFERPTKITSGSVDRSGQISNDVLLLSENYSKPDGGTKSDNHEIKSRVREKSTSSLKRNTSESKFIDINNKDPISNIQLSPVKDRSDRESWVKNNGSITSTISISLEQTLKYYNEGEECDITGLSIDNLQEIKQIQTNHNKPRSKSLTPSTAKSSNSYRETTTHQDRSITTTHRKKACNSIVSASNINVFSNINPHNNDLIKDDMTSYNCAEDEIFTSNNTFSSNYHAKLKHIDKKSDGRICNDMYSRLERDSLNNQIDSSSIHTSWTHRFVEFLHHQNKQISHYLLTALQLKNMDELYNNETLEPSDVKQQLYSYLHNTLKDTNTNISINTQECFTTHHMIERSLCEAIRFIEIELKKNPKDNNNIQNISQDVSSANNKSNKSSIQYERFDNNKNNQFYDNNKHEQTNIEVCSSVTKDSVSRSLSEWGLFGGEDLRVTDFITKKY